MIDATRKWGAIQCQFSLLIPCKWLGKAMGRKTKQWEGKCHLLLSKILKTWTRLKKKKARANLQWCEELHSIDLITETLYAYKGKRNELSSFACKGYSIVAHMPCSESLTASLCLNEIFHFLIAFGEVKRWNWGKISDFGAQFSLQMSKRRLEC